VNQYTATTAPAESFAYDDDGNMIADDTYAYTWDAETLDSPRPGWPGPVVRRPLGFTQGGGSRENRLIEVAPVSSPVNGDKRLEFKYDYMSRRVEKKYSVHDGSARGDEGGVICCDGQNVACAWFQHPINNPPEHVRVDIQIKCVTKHEIDHFDAVSCSPVCEPSLYRPKPRFPGTWISQEYYDAAFAAEECSAHRQEWQCYRDSIGDCDRAPNPDFCRNRIRDIMDNTMWFLERYCRGVIP